MYVKENPHRKKNFFKVIRVNIILFLTQPLPHVISFYVDFSISKDSFALKLIFRETDLRQRPKLFIFEKAPTGTLVASLNVVLEVVSIHEEFLFVFGVSRHFQGI